MIKIRKLLGMHEHTYRYKKILDAKVCTYCGKVNYKGTSRTGRK